MFKNLLIDNKKINFLEEKNYYIFEIKDFLTNEQYEALYDNFPVASKDEAKRFNKDFSDSNNPKKNRFSISEMYPELYNKTLSNNQILKDFDETIKDPQFTKLIYKNLYYKILRSRIKDIKYFSKLLFQINEPNKKNKNFIDKLFYNKIHTTMDFTTFYNDSKLIPHTDGRKKILSLLLYFPDDNFSTEQINTLGTTFYKSNINNLNNIHIDNPQKEKEFKKNNEKILTLPFKKRNLYGFIKSHNSWHTVEPINYNNDFIRKNININLLLV